MHSELRLFTPDDYPALSSIANANFPEYPSTPAEWQFNDEHRNPKHQFQRRVAEVDRQLVGFGVYGQFADMFHPRKFWLEVNVHPEHQRRGIGGALYDQLVASLEQYQPVSLRANIREDMQHSLRFAQQRGYEEEFRAWESRLEPATFDFGPFADQADRTNAAGVEIKTLRELEADPERDHKLYHMFVEVDADEPRPDPYTPWSYEFFVDRTLNDPNMLPDAYFVALHNGEYVGQTTLWASQGNQDLYTGLTGVKRAYRRKGIALALKLRAVAYAQAAGTPVVKTWNESRNRPILSINERLGFVKQPAWINLVKILRDE